MLNWAKGWIGARERVKALESQLAGAEHRNFCALRREALLEHDLAKEQCANAQLKFELEAAREKLRERESGEQSWREVMAAVREQADEHAKQVDEWSAGVTARQAHRKAQRAKNKAWLRAIESYVDKVDDAKPGSWVPVRAWGAGVHTPVGAGAPGVTSVLLTGHEPEPFAQAVLDALESGTGAVVLSRGDGGPVFVRAQITAGEKTTRRA